MHRSNYEMSLAQWLKKHNLPNVPDAEQFFLGQKLTSEEALRVRRVLMRAYLDSEGLEVFAETGEFAFPSNMPFLCFFLKLAAEGAPDYCGAQWKEQLHNTLTSEDHYALRSVLGETQAGSRNKKRHNK